jgi:hypothetical protein
MTDVRTALRELDLADPPDLHREAGRNLGGYPIGFVSPSPSPVRGVLIACVALLVAGASFTLLTEAFGHHTLRPGGEPAPSVSMNEAPVPTGWTTYTSAAEGFAISYPPGWNKSDVILTTHVPMELAALGTFPMHVKTGPGCVQLPTQALTDMGPSDAIVVVWAYAPTEATSALPQRPSSFEPSDGSTNDDSPQCVRGPVTFDHYLIAFQDHGRVFEAFVAIGKQASDSTRDDAWGILDTMSITTVPGLSGGSQVLPSPEAGGSYSDNGVPVTYVPISGTLHTLQGAKITQAPGIPAVSQRDAVSGASLRPHQIPGPGGDRPVRIETAFVEWNGKPRWVIAKESGNVCPHVSSHSGGVVHSTLVCINYEIILIDATTGVRISAFGGGTQGPIPQLGTPPLPKLIEMYAGGPGPAGKAA